MSMFYKNVGGSLRSRSLLSDQGDEQRRGVTHLGAVSCERWLPSWGWWGGGQESLHQQCDDSMEL